MKPDSLPERPPVIVPDHELLRCIGRGSYGEVWLARNIMGTFRAVKIVYRDRFDSERPFEREFSGIQNFEPLSRAHDSQLDILHVGRGTDFFYYVMELADDQVHEQKIDPATYQPRTLRSDLQTHDRLSPMECVEMGIALTTALQHLHEQGFVHRDVKPSNIVFVNGIPKLADIGLVTSIDATRSFVGTEGFLPPEGAGTVSADLYSLGKVLYEASTGRDRKDFPELPTNIVASNDSSALAELNQVVLKACAHRPERRYLAAVEMRIDLELLHAGRSVSKVRLLERRLKFALRLGIAAGTIGILTTVGFFFERHQSLQLATLAKAEFNQRKKAEANERAASLNLYAADMNLASEAIDTFRSKARELLDRHRPQNGELDMRGWEWRYMAGQCRSDEWARLPCSKENHVIAFGRKANSDLLAVGNLDGTIDLWHVPSKQVLKSLQCEAAISTLAFTANGKYMASGTRSGHVRLWNTESWEEIARSTFPHGIKTLQFSPDGKYLAVWSFYLIQMITCPDLRPLKRLPNGYNDDGPAQLSFSLDGKLLAAGGAGGKVWDWQESRLVYEGNCSACCSAAFDVGGEVAFAGYAMSGLKLWNSMNGLERIIPGSVGPLVFASSGRLVSAGSDQKLRVIDLAQDTSIVLSGHDNEIGALSLSGDGALGATASMDGKVLIWDLARKTSSNALGNFIFDCRDDLRTRAIPTTQARKYLSAFSHRGVMVCGNFVVGLLTNSEAAVFDTKSSVRVGLPEAGKCIGLYPSPLATYIVAVAQDETSGGGNDLTANIWHRESKKRLASLPLPADLDGLMVTESQIIVSTLQHSAAIITIENMVPVKTIQMDGHLEAISPDGKYAVVSSSTYDLSLWDLKEGSRMETMHAHSAPGIQVRFFPKQGLVVSSSYDGTLKFWNIREHRPHAQLTSVSVSVSDIAVSPDETRLVSVTADGTLSIWDTGTLRQLASFRTNTKTGAGVQPRAMFLADGNTLVEIAKLSSVSRILYAPTFEELDKMQF